MKIDLQGRYRDIAAYLGNRNTLQTGIEKGQEFKKLLGELKPSSLQATDNNNDIKTQDPQESTEVLLEKGPMARFSPSESEMSNPPLKRLLALGDELLLGERAEESVKSPTILGAKRIDGETGKATAIQTSQGGKSASFNKSNVKEMLKGIAATHGIDPYLGVAVARAESSFDPNAVSSDGHFSKGLFQLLDNTARDVIKRENLDVEYTPFEPKQNADIGIRYLRHLHNIFSKESELPNNMSTYPAANSSSLEKLAVAAYNAGEGRVASAQDRAARAGYDPRSFESVMPYLPESTQEYVRRVIDFRSELEMEYEG